MRGKRARRTIPLTGLLLFAALTARTSENNLIHGLWLEPDTQVQIRLHACAHDPALLCGHIVHIPPRELQQDVHNVDSALRSRPLLGLEIVSAFTQVSDRRWEGGGEHGKLPGRIYVPANGDTLGDAENRYQLEVRGDTLLIKIANCGLFKCLGKREWKRVADSTQ